MGSRRKRRKHKDTQRMDIGVMALHAGHDLREGWEPAEHSLAGRSDSKGHSRHVQGAWQTPLPTSPLSSPQTFADGSDSGMARQ